MRGFKHPVSCNSKTWHRSWRWLSACWWLWQLWLQVVDFKRLGTESSQIFQRWPNASSSLLLAQWQEVEMPWSCFAFLPPLNASNCNSLLLRFYTMLLHLYRFLIFTYLYDMISLPDLIRISFEFLSLRRWSCRVGMHRLVWVAAALCASNGLHIGSWARQGGNAMIHQGFSMGTVWRLCAILGCPWVLRNGKRGTKGNGDFQNIDSS